MASHGTFNASVAIIAFFLFMGIPSGQAAAGKLRKVNMREVEIDLQNSLDELLGGASASATQRLATIEASTWQTFQALPKNTAGRLAPAAVRYVVHGYFAKEHGWLIKGLEPNAMQSDVANVHEVSVLQDKVPVLVERLLEARQADRGLALNDVVTMIAVLEQLMFDESVKLLEAAYGLNNLPMDEEIDEETLNSVLMIYLVLFDQGEKIDLSDLERLREKLLSLKGRRGMIEFANSTVLNFEYARRHIVNPFRPRRYSFQAVAEITEVLAQRYGKWQNAECRDMKAHLKELDPEGLGRVPLGLFYAQPKGSVHKFSESSDYLRQIGALDESSSEGGAQVVIANYVAGPSNCIASSSYYSVCCLSDCDAIFNEIEHQVLAPSASPEKLLTIIRNISSETQLPQGLPEKLQAIAAHHSGEVPLHGRLFAQWLHFAFPHECPYPSVLESATALTPSQWLGGQSLASNEEKQQHIASPLPSAANEFNIEERWSEYEVLPMHAPSSTSSFTGAGIARTLMQLVVVLVALRAGCLARGCVCIQWGR